jgi:hypothetical protein
VVGNFAFINIDNVVATVFTPVAMGIFEDQLHIGCFSFPLVVVSGGLLDGSQPRFHSHELIALIIIKHELSIRIFLSVRSFCFIPHPWNTEFFCIFLSVIFFQVLLILLDLHLLGFCFFFFLPAHHSPQDDGAIITAG